MGSGSTVRYIPGFRGSIPTAVEPDAQGRSFAGGPVFPDPNHADSRISQDPAARSTAAGTAAARGLGRTGRASAVPQSIPSGLQGRGRLAQLARGNRGRSPARAGRKLLPALRWSGLTRPARRLAMHSRTDEYSSFAPLIRTKLAKGEADVRCPRTGTTMCRCHVRTRPRLAQPQYAH